MAIGNVACIITLISLMWMAEARIPGVYTGGSWESAHATFYGGSDASGTMGKLLSNPFHCLPVSAFSTITFCLSSFFPICPFVHF